MARAPKNSSPRASKHLPTQTNSNSNSHTHPHNQTEHLLSPETACTRCQTEKTGHNHHTPNLSPSCTQLPCTPPQDDLSKPLWCWDVCKKPNARSSGQRHENHHTPEAVENQRTKVGAARAITCHAMTGIRTRAHPNQDPLLRQAHLCNFLDIVRSIMHGKRYQNGRATELKTWV